MFSDTVSYIKLFMTTMKVKNGNQYKIQKSQDEGGNNAYKIFTRWVEEGYIPSTISHVELFMNTMKKKICNGYQYEIQKSWDGGRNKPIKSLRPRWRRDTFQTQCPMWNFSWLPWKKSQDGGGSNVYKIILCRVEEGNFICKPSILFGAIYSYNGKRKNFLNCQKRKQHEF